MRRGVIIALEGTEGSGKTTYSRFLAEFLAEQGYPAILVKEPSSFLRDVIKNRSQFKSTGVDVLLFAADRLRQFEMLVKPALTSGKVIVSDRSVFSSFAYQSVQGVDLAWLELLNSRVPLPDLVIVLDVDPSIGLQRTAKRNETSSFDMAVNRSAVQEKVRLAYHALAERYKGRLVIIDTTHRSTQEVQALIKDIVLEYLAGGGPIG